MDLVRAFKDVGLGLGAQGPGPPDQLLPGQTDSSAAVPGPFGSVFRTRVGEFGSGGGARSGGGGGLGMGDEKEGGVVRKVQSFELESVPKGRSGI